MTRPISPGTLGGTAALLGLLIALEAAGVFAQTDAPILAPPPAPVVVAARATGLTTPTAALEKAALERPLFSPARRPPAPDAGPAASVSAEPDRLPRVTGLLISGTGKSVLFAPGPNGKPLTVAEGGQVGGFTIRTIEADSVTVVSAAGVQVLHPSFDPNGPPPTPSATPAAYPTMQDIFKNGPPQSGAPVPPAVIAPAPTPYVPPVRPQPMGGRVRTGR